LESIDGAVAVASGRPPPQHFSNIHLMRELNIYRIMVREKDSVAEPVRPIEPIAAVKSLVPAQQIPQPQPKPVAQYETATEWAEAIVINEKDTITAFGTISKAAKHLAEKSGTDPTCAKSMKAKPVENLLRRLKLFPRTNRGKRP
jgi:hypothetical protein